MSTIVFELRWAMTIWLAVGIAELAAAAGAAAPTDPPRRAKPPTWSADVLDVFFKDAREHLVGERPARATSQSADATAHRAPATTSAAPTELKWSQLVSGDTLADEVKRVAAKLKTPLANAAKFKAGGYKDCQAHFGELAVAFAVIAEHDGEARWKKEAPPMRDAMARAGLHCEMATDEAFAEATQRMTELEDLIRGEQAAGGKGGTLEKWNSLSARPVLMQRMEELLQEQISPALGNEKQFAKAAPAVRQEAELLAMLAEVIKREEYEYWDDEGFRDLANELRTSAISLSRAAAEGNYEGARAAAGQAGQACSQCHEGWRG